MFSKINLLVIGMIVFGWCFGALSGFVPTYPKEIYLFFVMILSFLLYVLKAKLNVNIKTHVVILLVLSLPGLEPALDHPSVVFYFFSGFITFILLNSYLIEGLKLNLFTLVLFLVTLILFSVLLNTVGKLYMFGIQPSVTDLFFLAIFLHLFSEGVGENPKYGKIVFRLAIIACIGYGYFMHSRVLLVAPIAFFMMRYLCIRFNWIYTSGFISTVFMVCSVAYLGKFMVPDELFDMQGQISELGEIAGIEAKRLSLLLNGWGVLDNSGYLGVGFGPSAYLPHTTDNPLGISPQFLPLSLAVYSGVLFSAWFVLHLSYWVLRPERPEYVVSRTIIFSFILVHEYVFNPVFWVAIIILSQPKRI